MIQKWRPAAKNKIAFDGLEQLKIQLDPQKIIYQSFRPHVLVHAPIQYRKKEFWVDEEL